MGGEDSTPRTSFTSKNPFMSDLIAPTSYAFEAMQKRDLPTGTGFLILATTRLGFIRSV